MAAGRSGGGPRRFRAGSRVVLAILGAGLGLAAVELGLRAGGALVRPGPARGPEPAGGAQRAVTILCLGDSTTYGQGASDVTPVAAGSFRPVAYGAGEAGEDRCSYPSRLQQLLDASGGARRYRVVKAAVPGINSSQLLHRLPAYLVQFHPDVVILQIGMNDTWSLRESRVVTRYRGRGPARAWLHVEAALDSLSVVRFARLWWAGRALARAQAGELRGEVFDPFRSAFQGFTYRSEDPRRWEALVETVRANLAAMIAQARSAGARVLLHEYHADGWGYPPGFLNALYRQLGADVVETRAEFERLEDRGIALRAEDKWHPNDAGYGLLARLCYNRLVALGLAAGPAVPIDEPVLGR